MIDVFVPELQFCLYTPMLDWTDGRSARVPKSTVLNINTHLNSVSK